MKRKEKQMYECMYVLAYLAYLSACNPNSNEETPLVLRVFFFTQGSALEPHVYFTPAPFWIAGKLH